MADAAARSAFGPRTPRAGTRPPRGTFFNITDLRRGHVTVSVSAALSLSLSLTVAENRNRDTHRLPGCARARLPLDSHRGNRMHNQMDPAPRKAALARSDLSTDHYKSPASAQTATPHASLPNSRCVGIRYWVAYTPARQ